MHPMPRVCNRYVQRRVQRDIARDVPSVYRVRSRDVQHRMQRDLGWNVHGVRWVCDESIPFWVWRPEPRVVPRVHGVWQRERVDRM